jgi:hypothetical protein
MKEYIILVVFVGLKLITTSPFGFCIIGSFFLQSFSALLHSLSYPSGTYIHLAEPFSHYNTLTQFLPSFDKRLSQ